VNTPTSEVINSASCEFGPALNIDTPSIITIEGTKIIPPPIPKRLEIIPAVKDPI
jgi:hypothetical protein